MRATWWERLKAHLFWRPIVRYCSRCGRVLDEGQRLVPRGTTSVCYGVVDLARPGERSALVCIGAALGSG